MQRACGSGWVIPGSLNNNQFVDIPEPPTVTLLALGGPVLLRSRRR